MEQEDSFTNLYKKMDATSKTRFHASRRLRLLAKYSTYTIVIISLGLILISLMQCYELGNNISSDKVGLIQVFSAIAVLVYSLLIDKNNYSSLSEKMYSCASSLGELKQKLHPHINQGYNEETYNKFLGEYHSVLNLYETHSNNDFTVHYIQAKLDMPEHYEIKGKDFVFAKIKIYWTLTIDFLSYFLVIAVLILVLSWLWFG